MEKKLKFVEGIRVYGPGKNTPTFVKANLNFNRNELMMWLNQQPETFSVDIKESREGKYYMSVSEFVPKVRVVEEREFIPDSSPDDLPF